MSQSPPLPPPAAMPSASPALPPKPGYVQAIAIMCLVDGILSLLGGIALVIVYLCGLVTICCTPLGIYCVVLGVLEIIYATKVLPDPIQSVRPAQYLAIMQIINIVNFDPIAPTVGIISLVFYADPKVKGYFDAVQRKPAA
ncbi:MAG: hypothetical protein NT049_02335 [Planctomycetota bacterium]|nr:hypothetical protein [Planctomycetota bacterium]